MLSVSVWLDDTASRQRCRHLSAWQSLMEYVPYSQVKAILATHMMIAENVRRVPHPLCRDAGRCDWFESCIFGRMPGTTFAIPSATSRAEDIPSPAESSRWDNLKLCLSSCCGNMKALMSASALKHSNEKKDSVHVAYGPCSHLKELQVNLQHAN